ncbi:hypothetical protein J2Y58_002927 [Sphingomonas sp. BE138]|uniref:hypothetical protein n=1 Tax=Sphingomonas sp. BE138 TaxID=2817845 RepID=UPI002857BB25|nr:hypothetical protein [Sphingomonas sp. BE138]MDR6789554.1 hypothetical protein [Sphingomonas sp. BE138]
MAAEAQRAPLVREQSNFALSPAIAGRLQECAAALAPVETFDPLPSLGLFDRVPDGCDVVPVRGHVAIVERAALTTDDLTEGGIFVYERQYPLHPAADARRDCTRFVVRIYRDERVADAWRYRDLDRPHRPGEGPFHDIAFASMLIGRVIGVYQPKAVNK